MSPRPISRDTDRRASRSFLQFHPASHRYGVSSQIFRSSIVLPDSRASFTQFGLRPFPVQVCSGLSGFLYFGALLEPCLGARPSNSSSENPYSFAADSAACLASFSRRVSSVLSAFSASLISFFSSSLDILFRSMLMSVSQLTRIILSGWAYATILRSQFANRFPLLARSLLN